jgi:predicted amidohydrolase
VQTVGHSMRAAFVQFAPAFCNLPSTIESLDALLPRCADAELVVLPELCNSGYNFRHAAEAHGSAESLSDSRFLEYLTGQCRNRNCHIVSGFNERDGESIYNSAVIVGPTGLVGRYRKLHLFSREKQFFRPGNVGVPAFDCGGGRIGALVCFDWLFPEVWRVLMLKKVDIICHPANLVLPGLAQRAVPIHALMNRCFVITANRTGTERDLTFTGRSLIASPTGDVLREAPALESHVDSADLDLEAARDKQITPLNHLIQDRRPDQYGDLLK